MDLAGLADRVEQLAAGADGRRVIVGIAGAPGAGKTTLAEALVTQLAGDGPWPGSRVAHVPMDGFHLADVELQRSGLRHWKGAPETFDAEGYAALLRRIRAGESVVAPAFDRALEQPIAQSLPVTAASRIVITEGNYLLLARPRWQSVRALLDEVWFCRLPEQVRRERLIARHVRYGKVPDDARSWVARVDDANARLAEAGAATADLLIDMS